VCRGQVIGQLNQDAHGRQPDPVYRVRFPVQLQRWSKLTFLHWPYERQALQRVLPAGLTVETLDGQAWVGLTPFRMEALRPPGLPPVPRWSWFPETNLRTYVRGPDGRAGLWFFSLDAARLGFVLGLRAAGLPYHWADMALHAGDGHVRYRTAGRRLPRGAVTSVVEARPGRRLRPEELAVLDHFVTARWAAYHQVGGRWLYTKVEHAPWPLHQAQAEVEADEVLAAAGLPAPGGAPLVHYSPGVDVRVAAPERVRARAQPGAKPDSGA
jgi:uncharacterized protein